MRGSFFFWGKICLGFCILVPFVIASLAAPSDAERNARARDFGREARQAGVPAEANPYDRSQGRHDAWLRGWMDGQKGGTE